MQTMQSQARKSIITATMCVFFLTACSTSSRTVRVTSYSNIVADEHTVWFGAGHWLYSVQLDHPSAVQVVDTKDTAITFVALGSDYVIFGGQNALSPDRGAIWAYNKTDGKIAWKNELRVTWGGTDLVGASHIVDGVLVIPFRSEVVGIDIVSGEKRWGISYQWRGEDDTMIPTVSSGGQVAFVSPVVAQGASSSGGEVISFADARTGEQVSSITIDGVALGVPLFQGDYMYLKEAQPTEAL